MSEPTLHEATERLRNLSLALVGTYERWQRLQMPVAPQAIYLSTVLSKLGTETATRPAFEVALREARAFAAAEPIFLLTERCQKHLDAFLGGRRTGIEILFPKGDLSLWNEMQRHSLFMRRFSQNAASSLARLQLGTVDILEVGGGTGAATQCLLQQQSLPIRSYVFTDVSTAFLYQARTDFRSDRRVDIRRLDIDRCPTSQGFAPGSFDVIVAVNVLHVAEQIEVAVAQLSRLLRHGGVFLITEGAPPPHGVWAAEPIFSYLPQWGNSPSGRTRVSGFFPWRIWADACQGAGLTIASDPTPPWYSVEEWGGTIAAIKC